MKFLTALLNMLKEVATSKKILTAVLTGGAALLSDDPAWQTKIIALGGTLIAAMGLQDHGKAAAQVKAAAPDNVPSNAGK